MSESVTCPGCGTANPAGTTRCQQCNFPIAEATSPAAVGPDANRVEPAEAEPAAPDTTSGPPTGKSSEPSAAEAIPTSTAAFDPGPRPMRPRRARPDAMQPVQMQIWLSVGVVVVLGILYYAAQGFWSTHMTPVEGANANQQQRADVARKALAQDSTNLAARIELANTLYDTGNWSEAIIHYRSAERLEPHRATTVVDLGVCYYNLGDFASAESLFTHALTLDPKQMFALFNLGVVAESRNDWEKAIGFFNKVMELDPPEGMRPIVEQHLQAAIAHTGRSAPASDSAAPHPPH